MVPTCAANWVRRHSSWMRRRAAPSKRKGSGALPSGPGCRARTGRTDRYTSWRSMPIPVNRSCSTATAAWTGGRSHRQHRQRLTVPPHRIGDSACIDGGYRSNADNADLAAGYGRVLVVSPFGGRARTPVEWGMLLATQADDLRRAAAESQRSSRIASPGTHLASTLWIPRRVRPPHKPVTTRAGPCPRSWPNLALTPGKRVDSVDVTTPFEPCLGRAHRKGRLVTRGSSIRPGGSRTCGRPRRVAIFLRLRGWGGGLEKDTLAGRLPGADRDAADFPDAGRLRVPGRPRLRGRAQRGQRSTVIGGHPAGCRFPGCVPGA